MSCHCSRKVPFVGQDAEGLTGRRMKLRPSPTPLWASPPRTHQHFSTSALQNFHSSNNYCKGNGDTPSSGPPHFPGALMGPCTRMSPYMHLGSESHAGAGQQHCSPALLTRGPQSEPFSAPGCPDPLTSHRVMGLKGPGRFSSCSHLVCVLKISPRCCGGSAHLLPQRPQTPSVGFQNRL